MIRPTIRRWYGFEHPAPELLAQAVYGLPELHRDEIAALRGKDVAIVGAPGCYPTTTILALAPLARAGLIGDLVVDAKSGVSGAGRDPRPDLTFSEVNESVRAYGLDGHRHIAEIEQELGWLSGSAGAQPGRQRRRLRAPPRPDDARHLQHLPRAAELARSPSTSSTSCIATPTPTSRSWRCPTRPISTGQVLGSNYCRLHVTLDERSGRIRAIGVDRQPGQGRGRPGRPGFNIVFGLPETAGLEQLPLAP